MGVAERRQREREERRVVILDAAERVFLSKGVAVATMEEIAQQAEVSKGALYLYFKSKDELYLSIVTRSLRELVVRLERAAAAPGSGLERYRRLLHTHAGFALEEPDRFRVGIGWLNTNYSVTDDSPLFGEYRGLLERTLALSVAAIEQGKQDGSVVTSLDSLELATQIGAALFGLMVIHANRLEVDRRVRHGLQWERLIGSFVDLVSGAIAQPGRARTA